MCTSRTYTIVGFCLLIIGLVLLANSIAKFSKEMFVAGYNTAMIKNTLDEDKDEVMTMNISDEDDAFDFDISGMENCPMYAPADDPNIFLLNNINQTYPTNIAFFEPSVDDLKNDME